MQPRFYNIKTSFKKNNESHSNIESLCERSTETLECSSEQ